MAVRWILTVIAIFVMAYMIGVFVQKKDLPAAQGKKKILEIIEDYCVGCGLCVKLFPEYYEMKQNKAYIKNMPEGKEARQAVQESVTKCPSKAIIMDEEEKAS